MNKNLLFFIFLAFGFGLQAQTTLYFQGFENATPTCAENWGYTGGVRNNQTARTGTFSGMVGRSGTSATMTFNTVNVSGMAGLNLQVYHSVRGGGGPGLDTREGAVILVSLNGAAFTPVAQIGGFGDYSYTFATSPVGAASSSAGCNLYNNVPNPLNYNVPVGTNTIAVRIVSVGLNGSSCANYNTAMTNGTASLYDRADEGFHIDDVRLTTTSTFFTNVWTGNQDQNWHDCRNWSLGVIPTAVHNVLIDQSGIVTNNCRVSTANGVCNNLTHTSTNNNTQDLEVRGRTLNIGGDAVVLRAGTGNVGTGNLKFEAQDNGIINIAGNLTATMNTGITSAAELEIQAETGGQINVTGNTTLTNNAVNTNPFARITLGRDGGLGSFNCNNLTLTGNGSTNADNTRVEFFQNNASVFEVRGNFLMQNNARFNINGHADPIIRFGGNFSNQVSEAQFLEANSTIRFNGTGLQQISTTGFTERFHNVNLEKASGIVRLMNNIELSATGVLSLGVNQLDLNARELNITNTATGAITRSTGSIIEESGSAAGVNSGKINWTINNVGGAHVYPFARGVGGPYIPFTFERTAGNAGVVSISTYGTPPNNLPWPTVPDLVTNLNGLMYPVPDNRDATVDRFWQIDVTGTPTATMTFTYAPSELPVAPYNNPAALVAQRYDVPTSNWQPPLGGQVAGVNFVTVSGVTTFSPWTLASTIDGFLLPSELISFSGEVLGQSAALYWATETELNSDYFEVEASADGFDFQAIGQVAAAGQSLERLDYQLIDPNPVLGINYYRLKMVDTDGSFSYSNIIALEFRTNWDANTVQIFPNPLPKGTMLNIGSNILPGSVRIYDALGRVLTEYSNLQEAQIHLPDYWASGVYFLAIEVEGNIITRKLVIE